MCSNPASRSNPEGALCVSSWQTKKYPLHVLRSRAPLVYQHPLFDPAPLLCSSTPRGSIPASHICVHSPHSSCASRPPARGKMSECVHDHPGGNPVANLRSISHSCHLREEAFEWELTQELSIRPWVVSRVEHGASVHEKQMSLHSSRKRSRAPSCQLG